MGTLILSVCREKDDAQAQVLPENWIHNEAAQFWAQRAMKDTWKISE